MHTATLTAVAATLSLGAASITSAAIDAGGARTTLQQAGYAEVRELEFEHGLWQAEARRADGRWIDVTLDARNGDVLWPAAAGAPGLNDAQARAALTTAGFDTVHELEFDDGVWMAEASAADGLRYEVVLHPRSGEVLDRQLED